MTCTILRLVDPRNGDNEARIAIDTHFRDDESFRERATHNCSREKETLKIRNCIPDPSSALNSLRSHFKIHF